MYSYNNTLLQSLFHWKSHDYLNYKLHGRDKTLGTMLGTAVPPPKDFLNLCYLTCSREVKACDQDEHEGMGRL